MMCERCALPREIRQNDRTRARVILIKSFFVFLWDSTREVVEIVYQRSEVKYSISSQLKLIQEL